MAIRPADARLVELPAHVYWNCPRMAIATAAYGDWNCLLTVIGT